MDLSLLSENLEFTWLGIGVIIMLLEFIVPGFVIFFFGVGAIVVSATLFLFDIPESIQIIEFLLVSVLSLTLFRKKVNFLFGIRDKTEDSLDKQLDEYIGAKVIVTQRISPTQRGRIELFGSNWNAEADETIQEGEVVEVVKKDNLTLFVKKI